MSRSGFHPKSAPDGASKIPISPHDFGATNDLPKLISTRPGPSRSKRNGEQKDAHHTCAFHAAFSNHLASMSHGCPNVDLTSKNIIWFIGALNILWNGDVHDVVPNELLKMLRFTCEQCGMPTCERSSILSDTKDFPYANNCLHRNKHLWPLQKAHVRSDCFNGRSINFDCETRYASSNAHRCDLATTHNHPSPDQSATRSLKQKCPLSVSLEFGHAKLSGNLSCTVQAE